MIAGNPPPARRTNQQGQVIVTGGLCCVISTSILSVRLFALRGWRGGRHFRNSTSSASLSTWRSLVADSIRCLSLIREPSSFLAGATAHIVSIRGCLIPVVRFVDELQAIDEPIYLGIELLPQP